MEMEKEGYFDGGDIDVICLQYIYMEMIRKQIQTFVQVHNTYCIRRQLKREHYLPTGQPVQLYYYPPTGIRNYGSTPDRSTLSRLQAQVESYSLDEYLTNSTSNRYAFLLQDGGFQTRFSFSDNPRSAYIFLRQAVSVYIKNGGCDIQVLTTLTGANQWIHENQRQEKAQGIPWEFPIDLTDNEDDIPLIEEDIIDNNGLEELEEISITNSSSSISNSYYFNDDGFVLDI